MKILLRTVIDLLRTKLIENGNWYHKQNIVGYIKFIKYDNFTMNIMKKYLLQIHMHVIQHKRK